MSTLQVLLVDDSRFVGQMLRRELSPLAEVSYAESVEEACQRTRDGISPDLLICDFRLGKLNGSVLAGFMRKQSPHTAIVMMAGRNDREHAAESCEGGVDDVIEKPFFLGDAVSRIKRILNRLGVENASRNSRDVRGTLDQMSVVDLMQSLEIGRKTCLLELVNGSETSRIFFSDGRIDDAELGSERGDQAVYPVLAWTNGTFRIDFSQAPVARTTTRSTQGILMEGLRLLDEQRRDSE